MRISSMKAMRCLLQVATLAAALNLHAAIVSTTQTGGTGTFPVSKADLINADNPAFSSITIDDPANALFGSSEQMLNDGLTYGPEGPDSTGGSLTPADGTVVTIQLNTTAAPLGYDLKSVVSLTGWSDRSAQTYEVAVATVSSAVFTPLFGVTNVGGSRETRVTTQDSLGQPLATGVSALQINFHNANNRESVYREFDVFATGSLPTITTQPQPQAAELGSTASFTVAATGTGTLLYQWLFNGAAIDPNFNPSVTTTNLDLFSVAFSDAGNYSVAVDSAAGITVSSNASLKVKSGNVLFDFASKGLGSFTVSSNDVINSGQISFSSIAIDNPVNAMFGSGEQMLNDGHVYGPGESNYRGSTEDTLTPADGTVVTINLNTNTSVKGYDLTSIVSLAGGDQNRSQQNYDVAVAQVGSGVFTPLYSIVNLGTTAGNREVQVVATNLTASPMATNVAQIQVTFHNSLSSGPQSMYREFDVYGGPSGAVPTIAGQPQTAAVVIGGTATLTVSAQSTAGPISYQWQVLLGGNWTNLLGATSATLTLPQVTTNTSGSYRAIVSNVNGSTVSQPATLTVGAAAELGIEMLPGIIIQGTVGLNYRIDYTLSLTPPVNWQPLTTLTLPASPYLYVDTQAGGQQRYYRAVLIP